MSVGDVKLGNVRIARIVDRNGSRVNQDAITDAELRAAIIEQHGRHIQDRVDEELIRASAAVNRGDYPTRRASAMRFLELMRNRADIEAEPALSAFEQLDKLFIAQHIVANPALAAEGHKILPDVNDRFVQVRASERSALRRSHQKDGAPSPASSSRTTKR